LAVPLTILALLWLGTGLEPALSWGELMGWIGVHEQNHYTQLAVLGVLVVVVLAIVRIARNRDQRP
jgi:uncharacterized membrane protein